MIEHSKTGGDIMILGLGPGSLDSMPIGTYRHLTGHPRVWLRTGIHPAAEQLKAEGVVFQTCDAFYEKGEEFNQVYREIARFICGEAQRAPLIYAVPGHPMVAEDSVAYILQLADELGLQVEILPAMSFLDMLYPVIGLDPVEGFCLLDGLDLKAGQLNPAVPTVLTQVYSQVAASEVKLTLMEVYPDEHPIQVISAAGVADAERQEFLPLYELDRLPWLDHLTSVYLPPLEGAERAAYPLDSLVNVMSRLRGEGGCPWDREQNHQTLKKYLIEETYEVLEALDAEDENKICEELGDLLLQIVFHAQISKENAYFDINDVIMEITEKMIRRHPHVFGDINVTGSGEVLVNWEKIKAGEKASRGEKNRSLLDGIPPGLPALMQAEKLQGRAAKVGFDWPDYRGAWDKVLEELEEVRELLESGNLDELKSELGDLLFAIVNVSRFFKLDGEEALTLTNNKFKRRFAFIEEQLRSSGRDFSDTSLEEMDKMWELSKKKE